MVRTLIHVYAPKALSNLQLALVVTKVNCQLLCRRSFPIVQSSLVAQMGEIPFPAKEADSAARKNINKQFFELPNVSHNFSQTLRMHQAMHLWKICIFAFAYWSLSAILLLYISWLSRKNRFLLAGGRLQNSHYLPSLHCALHQETSWWLMDYGVIDLSSRITSHLDSSAPCLVPRSFC